MVYRHISPDLKELAVALLADGSSHREVADFLDVAINSISNWSTLLSDTGAVVRPPSSIRGRPRLLSARILDAIALLLREHPTLYLDELARWISTHYNVTISLSTLQHNLRDTGLTNKVVQKAPIERDAVRREAWVDYMSTYYVARQLVFVDESSVDNRTLHRNRGWAPAGERAVSQIIYKRGTRLSLLPALTLDGYIAVRVVEGAVDSTEFFDFIMTDLLPKMNPFPAENSVLVLDNCSIHKSAYLRAVIEGAGCHLVFLPPYSPDYNPIEMTFSVVKAYLRRTYSHANSDTPIADLLDACSAVTPEISRGFYTHCGY